MPTRTVLRRRRHTHARVRVTARSRGPLPRASSQTGRRPPRRRRRSAPSDPCACAWLVAPVTPNRQRPRSPRRGTALRVRGRGGVRGRWLGRAALSHGPAPGSRPQRTKLPTQQFILPRLVLDLELLQLIDHLVALLPREDAVLDAPLDRDEAIGLLLEQRLVKHTLAGALDARVSRAARGRSSHAPAKAWAVAARACAAPSRRPRSRPQPWPQPLLPQHHRLAALPLAQPPRPPP